MKKTLIALAVLTVSSAAFAQSSVTLSGAFGSAYQSYDTTTAAVAAVNGTGPVAASGTVGTPSYVAATNGTSGAAAVAAKTTANKGLSPVTDASIKATVVEDLGGGLKVTAAGQFAMNNSRGGSLTKEDSSVALAGGFGTVAFASTRSSDTAIAANVFPSWMPITSFYATVSARVAIDTLGYTSPAIIPGLTLGLAQAELTEGALTSVKKVNIISANYTNGPLAVMFAQKTTNGLTAAELTAGAKKNNTELAATYDLGVAKFGLGYDAATTTGTGAYTDSNMTSYGISVPMGAITLGVNGAKRGVNNFYDAGVNYDLSKRTSLRVAFGKLTNTSGSTNYNGNQSRVGILHSF